MFWSLCFVLAFAVGIQSKPTNTPSAHASFGPEYECLSELSLEMKDVRPFVHIVTDEENVVIGDYLACVWQKRKIMGEDGVSAKSIGRYLEDVYQRFQLSEENKEKMREAAAPCADLKADKDSQLAIKIKNCMITITKGLDFLPQQ